MRRLASTTIVLLALLLAMLAAAPSVSAQASDEHPAVGVWLTDGSPDDITDPLDLLTVAPGGIVTIALPDGTAYGPWAATGERMRSRVIVDGRNLLDPETLRAHGFAYEGIGRGSE